MLISTDGNRFAFEKAEVLLLTSMMASVDDHPNLAALWMHPAKAEAWEQGQRLTCLECRACNGGAPSQGQSHVQIEIHGQRARRALPLLRAI